MVDLVQNPRKTNSSGRQRFIATVVFFGVVVLWISIVIEASKEIHALPRPQDYAVETLDVTPTRIVATLSYLSNETMYGAKGNEIYRKLKLTIDMHNDYELRVRLTDESGKGYELPNEEPYPYERTPVDVKNPTYDVRIVRNPFSFSVVRRATNETLFDSSAAPLIFSKNYMELTTTLPTPYLYGLGERTHSLHMKRGEYTIWAYDVYCAIDIGQPGKGAYGHQPVYLGLEKGGSQYSHVVLLRNLSPQEVVIHERPSRLTYKLVAGIIDLKIFLSDEGPEKVLERYHEYLGGWRPSAFWAMGNQQSRWGYKKLDDYKRVLADFRRDGIPLDGFTLDIDYMDKMKTFTVDEVNFPPNELTKFVTENHPVRFAPIVGPVVKTGDSSWVREGTEANIFIRNGSGQLLQGLVWPGKVHFVDFFNPNITKIWTKWLSQMRKIFPFTGVWLDMNEPANFCAGECPEYEDERLLSMLSAGSKKNPFLAEFPFQPGDFTTLDYSTVSVNAKHYGDVLDVEVHGGNGYMQTRATYHFLKEVMGEPLPFILFRANTFGSGRFGVHWLGDGASNWLTLRLYTAGIMSSNIFGIPMSGGDICGFSQDTTLELCARWYQVGAFYPYARNHNTHWARAQEPQTFGPKMVEVAKTTMLFRYSILKWMYSLFFRAKGKGTIFRAVFLNFPGEEELLTAPFVDDQFMLGEELLITPIVHSNIEVRQAYFPKTTWFEFHEGKRFIGEKESNRKATVQAPLNATAPIFLRAGYIIYTQNATNVQTTADLELDNTFALHVALQRLKETSEFIEYGAYGRIMAVSNYSDYSHVRKCDEGDCIVKVFVNATYRSDGVILTVRFSMANNAYYEPFRVSHVRVMGLDCFSKRQFRGANRQPRRLQIATARDTSCLLYTSPSPRDRQKSRMPSSA
eukprot:TRINITY_DN9144_c0_g1_i2.p1 TRINITY_DN9144_c0_g1~~TRINITY_DN9144_c0_g1_i2.p1  ORF type:complete len:911 (+),score=190.74 TRINITY_DN9144_c0_g1_i2:44-2776(+)